MTNPEQPAGAAGTASAPAVNANTIVTAQNIAELRSANPDANIPGLEISWKEAEQLGLTDEAVVAVTEIKRRHKNICLVPTNMNVYVFLVTTRAGYNVVLKNTADILKKQEDFISEADGNQALADLFMTMKNEDLVVQKFLVYPQLSLEEIRSLPPGEVKVMYDSLQLALGYNQPPRAVRI